MLEHEEAPLRPDRVVLSAAELHELAEPSRPDSQAKPMQWSSLPASMPSTARLARGNAAAGYVSLAGVGGAFVARAALSVSRSAWMARQAPSISPTARSTFRAAASCVS